MADFPTTTVGKAFDASFDKGEWRSYESPKGERFVEFTGVISPHLHAEIIAPTLKVLAEAERGESSWSLSRTRMNLLEGQVKRDGIDGGELVNLNKRFGCAPPVRIDNQGQRDVAGWPYYPQCPNDEVNEAYLIAAQNLYLAETWPIGMPVKARWLVAPKGERFDIHSMESDAWVGERIIAILTAIYR